MRFNRKLLIALGAASAALVVLWVTQAVASPGRAQPWPDHHEDMMGAPGMAAAHEEMMATPGMAAAHDKMMRTAEMVAGQALARQGSR